MAIPLIGGFAAASLLKRIVKIITMVVFVVVVYLAVTAAQVWLTSRHSSTEHAQAIVVMGAAEDNGTPTPDLVARLQEALTLYRTGRAPLVVGTGGGEPGDRFTESEVEATWLEDHGVPARRIITVDGGTTWQSLSLAAAALEPRNVARVLIVTDGFHEDRSMAIASQLGLAPAPAPATNSPIKGWSTFPYFAKETVGVAVGRIIGYSHLEWLHRVG